MTAHGAPRPAMAPCGRPRTKGRGFCTVLTPGGRPCRDHGSNGSVARVWTPQLIQRLEGLLEDGFTDRQAGQQLGLTARAIANARQRYGLARRDQILMTTAHMGRTLGCSQGTVVVWARRGWIRGTRHRGRGGHRQWMFDQTQLMAFLEDPEHWHRWQPDDIPDARLREWASRLRGEVEFLTVDEAAARMFCSRWTVRTWVQQGRLPGYTGQCLMVRADELARMATPEIGQGSRKRRWDPCPRCGDPDGKVPLRGRTPGRRDGRPFGFEGRICETCYARLRAAACKQQQRAA